jgi:hypothetical protein
LSEKTVGKSDCSARIKRQERKSCESLVKIDVNVVAESRLF